MYSWKLSFFLLNIYLEYSVVPKYISTYMNEMSILLYSVIILAFYSKYSLRKYSNFVVVFVVLMDQFCGYHFIKNFYRSEYLITEISHYLLLVLIVILPFLFYNDYSAYKEFKESLFLQKLFGFLVNILSVHFLFNHFKNFHLKSVQSEDFSNPLIILYEYLVDFGLNFNAFTVTSILLLFKSKNNKTKYMMNILKRIFALLLITAAFYANYNTELNELIYNKFNEYVPQPHNVIFYNLMPLDANMRFRLIITTIIYAIY